MEKPSGFIILGTPNRDRLASILYGGLIGRRKFPWREHLREYDKMMLYNIVKRVNFSRIHITGHFLGLHSVAVVIGFNKCPNFLERWCNFWFIELIK